MATLPTEEELTGASVMNWQQKLRFAAIRNYLADLLGTDSSDKAAARAALGAVGSTGDETIEGVKTFSSPPVVPTPPQFDTSTNAATMEALQRALGNRSGYERYETSKVLTAADVGKYIVAMQPSMTLTLPDATTLPPGSSIYIQAAVAATTGVIVSNPNGHFSGPTTSGAAQVVVHTATAMEFISGAGGWLANGAVVRGHLSNNGYYVFPGGLIIQWGTVNTAYGSEVLFNFPLAFPVGAFNIQTNHQGGVASVNTVGMIQSTTQGSVSHNYSSGNVTVHWLAIGR